MKKSKKSGIGIPIPLFSILFQHSFQNIKPFKCLHIEKRLYEKLAPLVHVTKDIYEKRS